MKDKVANRFRWLAAWVAAPMIALWSLLAVWYGNLPGKFLPALAVLIFAIAFFFARFRAGSRRVSCGLFIALFGIALIWHLSLSPSNDRNWQPQVARLATADFSVDGKMVTVHNVRNSVYRSISDFDLRYEKRQYDLDRLAGVDFFVSYWGNRSIAHTFLSFSFDDNRHLAVSIETRLESGESYSPLAGLFRQYEIYYAVGDERDIVGLRTNHRDEETYLYQSSASAAQARMLFVDILKRMNQLAEEPDFYGTIRQNCTTALVRHVNTILTDKIPFTGRLLFNGFSDELAYSKDLVRPLLSFEKLRAISNISPIARRLDSDPAFSVKLRERLQDAIAAQER